MKKKIKAMFFDIDGTLTIFGTGKIPEETVKTLWDLHEAGIRLFVATGRHEVDLWKVIPRELPFDGYITLNGQIGLDRKGEVIFHRPLHPEAQEAAVRLANQKETLIMLVEMKSHYLNAYAERMEERYREFGVDYPPIREYDGGPLYQVSMYDSIQNMQALIDQIPHCKPACWGFGFDLIPEDGGKIWGIKEMIQHFGIEIEETMAFGDAENDLDMIQYCGIGVAMAKAPEQVRSQADFVTKDAGEGGIRYAAEHFGIL